MTDDLLFPPAKHWITHGLDMFERADGKVTAWRGSEIVGKVSPWVAGDLVGDWYGRRAGEPAGRFKTRHAALAHVVGGCPECRCEPFLCGIAGGLHCEAVNCGPCLHGCPKNQCDMTEEG